MYDLFVDGLRDLQRSLLFKTTKLSFEGLVGETDGENRVFFTVYQPLLSAATTTVYLQNNVVDTADYTLDLDTGVVYFNEAPDVQPRISYTVTSLSSGQINNVLWSGFLEMEGRWNRGYRLSSSALSYIAATGAETHAYVMDATTATDPVVYGTVTFSTSLVQRGLYVACCDLILLISQANYMASTAFAWREDRGMAVDKKGVAPNLEAAIKRQTERIDKVLAVAQEKAAGGTALGYYIRHPRTEEYEEVMDWQTYWRETEGYE